MKQRGIILFIVAVLVTLLAVVGMAYFMRREPPRVTQAIIIERPEGSATGLAFSPDGSLLAIGRQDGQIMLWDVEAQAERLMFRAHPSSLSSVVFSADGRLLATTAYGDNGAMLWDVQTGTRQGRFSTGDNLVSSVTLRPDGNAIAVGTGAALHVWNLVTGEKTAVISDLQINHLAYSADGWWLAVSTTSPSGTPETSLYNAATFALSATFPTERVATFSTDGAILVSTNGEKLLFHDLADNRNWQLSTFQNTHDTLALNADVSLAAVSDLNHEIWLWEINSGQPLVIYEGHNDVVENLAFSPDGTVLASGGWDGTVRLWEIPE